MNKTITNAIAGLAGKILEKLADIGEFMFQKPIEFILIFVALILALILIFRKQWRP